MKKKISFLKFVEFSILAVLFLIFIAIALFWAQREYSKFQADSQIIRKIYLEIKKEQIRDNVNNLISYIELLRNQIPESQLENENERLKGWIEQLRFSDRTGYYFILDEKGNLLSHGGQPDFVGSNLREHKDKDGVFVAKELETASKKAEGGFAYYKWPKPGHPREEQYSKLTFVRHAKSLPWNIGAGIYIDDIDHEVAKRHNEMMYTILWNTFYLMLLMSIILLMVYFFLIYIRKEFSLSFKEFELFFKKSAIEKKWLNTDNIHFKELIPVADLVNNMTNSMWEQIDIEKALYASEKKYKILYESMRDGLVFSDKDGKIIQYNEVFCQLLGYDDKDIIGRHFIEFTANTKDQQRQKELSEQMAQNGYIPPFEKEYIKKDGTIFPVEISSVMVSNPDENISIMSIVRDISKRKQAESALRESENRYRVLVDMAVDGILIGSNDGIIIEVNECMCAIVGMPREEFVGKHVSLLPFTKESLEKNPLRFDLLLKGETVISERIIIRPDKSEVVVEMRTKMMPDGTYQSIYRDITTRKKAERKIVEINENLENIVRERTLKLESEISIRAAAEKLLRESELKFKLISEASPIGIFIFVNDKIEYVNQSFSKVFGYSCEEITKMSPDQLILRADLDQYMDKYLKLIEGKLSSASFELAGKSKDGRYLMLAIYISGVDYKDGRAVMGSLIDITERIEMERQLGEKNALFERINIELEKRIFDEVAQRVQQEQVLMKQSRLASMGEMVGVIAHQWRQPLNAVGLILSNAKDDIKDGKITPDDFEVAYLKIMNQLRFMSKTIDDFRGYFSPEKGKEHFDIVTAIKDGISFMTAQLKNNSVEVIFEKPDYSLPVLGHRNELMHVFYNLMNNAKDSIVERSRKDSPEFKGVINVSIVDGNDSVEIIVADNGLGVPEHLRDRIFEPYFTTKESGMGVGLFISKRIIEDSMNGKLWFEIIDFQTLFHVIINK